MQNRFHKYFIPILLFILATVVQVIFLNPVILSDQAEYYGAATTFPNYNDYPSHWNLRIGLIVPVALAYRVFGYSELSYYLFPVLSFNLLVLFTYYLGKIIFDTRVGVFAALALLCMPGFLFESGNLLPDIPASMAIMIAFYLFFRSNQDRSGDTQTLSKGNLIYFFIGVFSGWAYLLKEYFLMFVFVLLVFFVFYKKTKKQYLLFFSGLALMVALECLFGLLVFHNPFIRLMTASPRETWGYIERDVGRIFTFFPRMLLRNGSVFHLLLGIVGFVYLAARVIKKDYKSGFGFLLLWIITVYAFFTFFGLLPVVLNWQDKVLIRPNIFRYWSPIYPAVFIAAFAALFKLADHFTEMNALRKWLRPALVVLILVGCSLSVAAGYQTARQEGELLWFGGDHYLELRDYLASIEKIRGAVWVVRELRIANDMIIPIYLNNFYGKPLWQGHVNYLNIGRNFLKDYEIEKGYVVVDTGFSPEYTLMPDYFVDPPDAWVKVFESENGRIRLYCVNCSGG